MSNIITRFAPSPTGELHLGSARTALFSWLFAKHFGGQFILRIEDTDLERSTQASSDAILAGMAWLGLDYDQGPYYQTHRMKRYSEVIDLLLSKGSAYRCTCSKERLEKLRDEQMKAKIKPRYDGHCRNLEIDAGSAPFVIRFSNPLEGFVYFSDQVYGNIQIANAELDDFIIARSDGSPTYNFTVVVDDWDMKISHVIRGDDHINNTPKQINLLMALEAKLPIYAHLPMILGPDGKRLSKRHGATSVMQFQKSGYLPEALLNYLVRLGWSHGDQEIFSQAEMIDYFDFKGVSKSAACFDYAKLAWLNQQYFKTLDKHSLVPVFEKMAQEKGLDCVGSTNIAGIIAAQADRVKTMEEMVEKSRFFYEEPDYDDEALEANHFTEALHPVFESLLSQLETLVDWNTDQIHQIIQNLMQVFDLKMGKIAQPLRFILTGSHSSPSIDTTVYLLGKEKVISRLEKAMKKNKKSS